MGPRTGEESPHESLLLDRDPAAAYAADLARLERDSPCGQSDDSWLVLAHALHRCAALSPDERSAAVLRAADAVVVCALTSGLPEHDGVIRFAQALRRLYAEREFAVSNEALFAELTTATQAVAEEQELAGLLGLAYATLQGLLDAFAHRMTPRHRGGVIAQQARAARVAGARDLAHELYESAVEIGYEAEAYDVVARALGGLGNMALARGNFPAARTLFERCMANAERATDTDQIRSAHQGLLNVSWQSKDVDSALVHAWNVLRVSVAPESRAEALLNIGEVCRMAGEHKAALRVYRIAEEWSSRASTKFFALNGILQSTVASGRYVEAREVLASLDAMTHEEHDVYNVASLSVEIAAALFAMGDTKAAARRLNAAMALATKHKLHSVIYDAEQLASAQHFATDSPPAVKIDLRPSRPRRSEHFRMVLRSLNGLASASL
jgi:tetratricopeptide (TPR) repeat protein